MRVISFLLLALFIYSSCKNTSTQIELQNVNDVQKALAHKWAETYMETLGNRVTVPESQMTVITFNENGTLNYGVKNGILAANGEWKYEPGSQKLSMKSGGSENPARIIKLTGNELILTEYMLGNDVVVDSTVVTYKRL